MFQAVEAPVVKVAALAGAVLMLGAFVAPRDHSLTQRLELHAPKRPRAIYETLWAHGDVNITFRDGVPAPRAFQKRSFHFGCEWLSVETIAPAGHNRYFYTYDEEKLSCAKNAPKSIATPRTGYAIVVDSE